MFHNFLKVHIKVISIKGNNFFQFLFFDFKYLDMLKKTLHRKLFKTQTNIKCCYKKNIL